jgi:LysM repeat protein
MKSMREYTRAGLLLAALALVAGCGRNTAGLDRQEEQDPLIQRARELSNAQDINGALDLYNKAIARRPTLARAHLEAASLYDSYKEDYIRAVYHYQRYIELRPDAEKKDLINSLIQRCRISYAASLPDTPSGAIEEIAELKQTIAQMEKENQQLRAKLGKYETVPKPQPTPALARIEAPTSAAPSALEPAPAQAAVQSYVVQEGDTLSRIAGKVYNDPRQWAKIFEANRATLVRPENIKVGQTLVIP